MQLFQSRAMPLQNCSEIRRGNFCSAIHSSEEPLRFFTRQMEREQELGPLRKEEYPNFCGLVV